LNEPYVVSDYDRVWAIVRDYATWIGDDDLLQEYQDTLRSRPWEKCDCPICREYGVEVCIFRGTIGIGDEGSTTHDASTMNSRKTFEDPRRDPGDAAYSGYETVEDYLRDKHSLFWTQTHDLPVAEIGVLDANGVSEWWEENPSLVSFAPDRMAANVGEQAARYQHLFVHTLDCELDEEAVAAARENGCEVHTNSNPRDLRDEILEVCGQNYAASDDFVPHPPEIDTENGLDILVIDQCSGSKEIPDDAPIFGEEETLQFSREDLLARDNVPGIAARDLYTGRQQNHVKSAVRWLLRQGHDVDRYFVSAGFGLVAEDEYLPYEVTFSSMNVSDIRERSAKLDIQKTYDTSFKRPIMMSSSLPLGRTITPVSTSTRWFRRYVQTGLVWSSTANLSKTNLTISNPFPRGQRTQKNIARSLLDSRVTI